jgi:hypothetical protein
MILKMGMGVSSRRKFKAIRNRSPQPMNLKNITHPFSPVTKLREARTGSVTMRSVQCGQPALHLCLVLVFTSHPVRHGLFQSTSIPRRGTRSVFSSYTVRYDVYEKTTSATPAPVRKALPFLIFYNLSEELASTFFCIYHWRTHSA